MGNRILVIVSRYSKDRFDPGDFVTELSEWISRKGFEVSVLAPHGYKLKFSENINGINVYRFPYFFPFKYQKVAYGPGILDNLKNSYLAKIQVPLFLLSELFFTMKIVKSKKIDIIHSHWIVPQGLIGAIIKKLYKIFHVATVHGSDVNMIKKNRYLKKVGSFIIRNTNKVTVNSTFTKNLILDIDSRTNVEKLEIIPMGIDLKRFYPVNGISLKKKYTDGELLLFVGRLIDWKGALYLVKAMKDVLDTFPKTKLLIIGDGPERPELEKLILELKLKENINLLGEIKSTDVAKYYSAADILVIPSIVVAGHTEGLGVVTLEAMACGTPAIGTNVGGIPDVIKDGYNGFLVPPKSSDALATKIIDILSNQELQEFFRKNGIRTVKENFSWNIVSEKFVKIISRNLTSVSKRCY